MVNKPMIGFNKLEQAIKREGNTFSFLFGFHEFSPSTFEPELVKTFLASLFRKHHFILFWQECFLIPVIFESIVLQWFYFYLMTNWISVRNEIIKCLFIMFRQDMNIIANKQTDILKMKIKSK